MTKKRIKFDVMVLRHVRQWNGLVPQDWVKAKFLCFSFLPFRGDIAIVRLKSGEEVGFADWDNNIRGLTPRTAKKFGAWKPKIKKASEPKP